MSEFSLPEEWYRITGPSVPLVERTKKVITEESPAEKLYLCFYSYDSGASYDLKSIYRTEEEANAWRDACSMFEDSCSIVEISPEKKGNLLNV